MAGFHTIGMAGHIDHGKTSLTKALTGIDTDRLAEEKARGISIEPGYAELELDNGKTVSIVDVPGHNRLIRQMIAGIAGIDLVIFTIDVNEGVMPQTSEHMEIIEFLGIKHGLIVLTKVAGLDNELLELALEDVQSHIQDTVFKGVPILFADSLSGEGIGEIKTAVANELAKLPSRSNSGPFRMPIDHCFTLKGKGIVARGTVQEGTLHSGEELKLLPLGNRVRAREIQVRHKKCDAVHAGERAAINLMGPGTETIQRGDMLVAESHQVVLTDRIDVSLRITRNLDFPIKQRSPIRLYMGTQVVNAEIIYFDRNVAKKDEEILCQIRIKESVACKRGDRFIIRRPSPSKTIGGGWVMDPNGERYRFGTETVQMLQRKKDGSPMERIHDYLEANVVASIGELVHISGRETSTILEEGRSTGTIIAISNDAYTLKGTLERVKDRLLREINQFHLAQPLVQGMRKAEVMQRLSELYPKQLANYAMDQLIQDEQVIAELHYIAAAEFTQHLPAHLTKPVEKMLGAIKQAGLTPGAFEVYAEDFGIEKKEMEQIKQFLLKDKVLWTLRDSLLVHSEVLKQAIHQLKSNKAIEFSVGEAKAVLGISRKYLIPLLELLDSENITIRSETGRIWNDEGRSFN